LKRDELVQAIAANGPFVVNEPSQDSLPTHHSLLNRLKDLSDDTSWREFFQMYWELIYNVARKAGLSDTEAQEAVQETVIGVAKRIGEFKTGSEHGSFKAWLLQQTRWRVVDQFRKRPAWQRAPGESPSAAGGLPAPPPDDESGTATVHRIPDPASLELDKAWDAEWEQHLMRTALERVKAKVSVKQFQMFDLHARQGLSVKDTALALGASVASVYMAASRVRSLLKAEARKLHEPRE
jgi:RNA polymerase sigma-70 factor (ECF subfamily)